MKIARELNVYCPKCGKHTEHKVVIYSKKQERSVSMSVIGFGSGFLYATYNATFCFLSLLQCALLLCLSFYLSGYPFTLSGPAPFSDVKPAFLLFGIYHYLVLSVLTAFGAVNVEFSSYLHNITL